MAYYSKIPAAKTLYGTLSAGTLFTCKKGTLGLSTDGAPVSRTNVTDNVQEVAQIGQQYRELSVGESLFLSNGLTVYYQRLNLNGECEMHVMPA